MPRIDDYGRFDEAERCFILEKEPPRKWLNLHYNKVGGTEIFCEASYIGDGVTCIRDWDGTMYDLISWDSKYLYIRDDDSGVVFSPSGHPVARDVTEFSCKYGQAKTEISGTCEGLRATHRIFIPRDYVNEVWTLRLENLTNRPRRISVFAYAILQVSGFNTERNYIGNSNYSEIFPEHHGVLVTNRNRLAPNNRFKAYLLALENFAGANGYRDQFLRSEFSVGTPRILWGWNCDNKGYCGADCAGIVQVRLEIPANGQGRADFIIGQATGPEDMKKALETFTPAMLDRLCEEQVQIEKTRSETFRVNTGHKNIDGLMNFFVKKQLYSYLVHKAGFRDNVQVDNALAMFDYETAKSNFLRAIASQFADGAVPHSFRPMNRKTYADMPYWMIPTAAGMVKETGDYSLLKTEVPYFESNESGPVWDHMVRAMRRLTKSLGKNGLVDQHVGDWNDDLEPTHEAGARESVMVSFQLCHALLEMQELAGRIGDEEIQKEASALYKTFSNRINEVAWDGAWYVRTICGDGYRIGSAQNEEAKVWMDSLPWAVISKVATGERATLVMDAIEKYCKTDVGYRVCAPAFTKYDPRTGKISNLMPDTTTNGGCYNHSAGFKAVADCMLGRAEQAWETFLMVAPDNPKNPVSQSNAEPFSFVNWFTPCKHMYGNSGYAWRTGTSGWFTILLVEWILGARRSYDGLLIDPCLSKAIPKASVMRPFRGARYHIELDNTAGRCKGARQIVVDGQKIAGNLLPIFLSGDHHVEVMI